MLRVFSSTGFIINLLSFILFWITDFRDYRISRMISIIVGANGIRPPMIQIIFPIIGKILPCRDAMLHVFSSTGFIINLPSFIQLWITDFRDYRISRMISIIVGANGIRPPMIQIHFPINGIIYPTVRLSNAIRSYHTLRITINGIFQRSKKSPILLYQGFFFLIQLSF
jgi:hypothetical protein